MTVDAFTSDLADSSELRSHPWTSMQNDQSCLYMDFKKNPYLIRNSLEDFLPLKQWAFVESFYKLIEWVNSAGSLLESNDCTFNVAEANSDKKYAYAKKCSARLMILFRDIPENCQQRSIDWLVQNILHMVVSAKLGFQAGAICLSKNETCYLELSDKPDEGGIGQQVIITLFAYGKNDRRCYESMEQVINHLHNCLKKVNKKLKNGELDDIYR